jgi:hypothetical protein
LHEIACRAPKSGPAQAFVCPPIRVPEPGQAPTPAFDAALNRYLRWDLTATAIYYVIVVFWIVTP